MKRPASILLCCLAACPLLAAPFDGVDWDKSRNDILRQLPKSSDLTLSATAKSVAEKLVGGCTLNEEIAYQKWTMHFNFNKKATALESIVLIGSEGFDSELWDSGVFKSYYLFYTNILKEKYGLGDKSINTPHYDALSKVIQSGDFYPIHSYKADGLVVTIGAHYDKKDKTLHAAFMLEKGMEESALGETKSTNPNVLGEASEWLDIAHWESAPEAEEFLVRVGVIKPKVVTPAPAEGGDATITFTIGGDGDAGEDEPDLDTSEEDTTPELTPAELAISNIDSSLPEEEQALLKSIITINLGEATADCVQTLNDAARKGNGRALYQLALCTEEGKGVTADSGKAEKFYLAAAQSGYALALVRFDGEQEAALASIGFGAAEVKSMVNTIQEEAKGTSVSARLNLAVMYRYGFGVRKDVAKARALLEKLRSQGDTDAAELLEKLF